jgi:Protein of unknown function (DUF2833)
MSREVAGPKPVIKAATKEDCDLLAKTLRKADLEEISHACGLPPQIALRYSLASSDYAYTVWMGDEIVFMFGVGEGVPWMMASDLLLQVKREFVRECRKVLQAMLDRYGHLENHVWAGNKLHIYWLEWLGFTIEPAKPYGIDSEPFHKFYMTR